MTDRTASRPTPTGSTGQDHLEPPAENTSINNSIVNNVVYLDGRPAASPATLADTFQLLEQRPDSMAWIGLYRPAEAQLMAAATQLGLHELAVEDAITAHQRPKLERYDDTLFIVLRSAHYRDDTEQVDFGELHLFVGAIPTGPWQDWAARLVPTLTLEAVIAWLDAGQPSPDHAADRIGHAIQGAIQAAQTD